MVNFVIVEDNRSHKNNIKNIIMSFMMKNKLEFCIKEFADYTKELVTFIKNRKEDTVYILDLELPSGDGIDIARLIRNVHNDWRSPIIICTAHTSLAYEVYKQRLQVLDFVGKCFNVEKCIKESLEICLKMLNIFSCYRYTYHNIEYCVSYDDIDYIQRDDRRTLISTKSNKYYQNISINNIKKMIPKYFVSSAKGTLINMKNVKRIDWNDMKVYFKDNDSGYMVSQSHKKEIMKYEHN